MALKLRVISDHYKALGKRSSRLFGVTGGRIGRALDNDWVLPDPDRYVSSHHCRVSFRAGKWILEDTSTNGVFINGSDTPASVHGPYTLKDGDRLRLGEYELLVSIDERNDFPPDASGQMPAPRGADPAPVEDLGEELDLTDLLADGAMLSASDAPRGPDKSPRPAQRPTQSGFASLLEMSGEVPGLAAPPPATPGTRNEDWQMQTRPYDRRTLAALTSPAALAREPRRTSAEPERPRRTLERSGEVGEGIEAFCRGAGIDPSALDRDTQNALLTLAGQMLRETVLGLMEVLKSRTDAKSRLRLDQTTIQPRENNPLKFSASVDEAVVRLLDPHGSRFLGPIEAIRDSFASIRSHQSATTAAIQAAVDGLMKRLEPRELEERFDRGLRRGALLGAANKMKYWDLYTEFYNALNQRNEQGLPQVFAEEFARTYAAREKKK